MGIQELLCILLSKIGILEIFDEKIKFCTFLFDYLKIKILDSKLKFSDFYLCVMIHENSLILSENISEMKLSVKNYFF